ncbi:dermonecrotic toxin domain-containing protein [Pseudomonas sp. PSKL.D1]|uniref:dermonecrotic toxin domain-containing protein n=1 Tax=Pseudomonas sp. PSKL.D1 TaxID=3029060 RepID=UPI0023816B18|nr:DUF6543 domain-containing protein [Pseudomonas sp. PSKL.D1]WDY60192.1 hypothetical protein PVV54_11385 [Pseudomonas sp. PSKL.D1]
MTDPASQNLNHYLIAEQLPAWAQQANATHWQALRESLVPSQGLPQTQAAWFDNAAPDLREAVIASQALLECSQQALARSLKGLNSIAAFAEPLLAQKLQADHGLSVPLHTTELVQVHHRFTFGTYVTTHTRTRLLEAALHNFEDGISFGRDSALALAGDATFEPLTVVGQTTLGDSETQVDIDLPSESFRIKALALTPEDFATACRELDLGQRYQAHLRAMFSDSSQPVRANFIQVQRDRLRLAADLAVLHHAISGQGRDAIGNLLAGATTPCWQATLFGIPLHEVLIIEDGHGGLLLYLPGDEQAVLQFAGLAALHQHLATQLLQPAYRKAFQRYVSTPQRHRFADLLRQNLDATGDTPDDQPWPVRQGADLHLRCTRIERPLFAFLYDDHVTRLHTEAATVAVPTADVDAQAHQRRVEQWESLGLNVLMLAGMFVPALGTVMTAVLAWQLMDEVYEGYQAWSIGDRHLALQHVENVALNLTLIGGIHALKLLKSSVLRQLEPIRMPDGSRRLWRADLTGYASPTQLPPGLHANQMGLYSHLGATFMRMDGELYEVRLDEGEQRWRIKHPSDANAYEPLLEHNGEGSWRGEHESPLAWPDSQAVRRLGLPVATLNDTELQQALVISGVSRARLQAVHLAGEPTPPLLASTLQRMVLAKRLPALSQDALVNLHAPVAPGDTQAALARAIEGLYIPGLGTRDSERLLLACVQRLDRWPTELRLDIRANSPNSELLASIGDTQAGQRCLLLRSGEGYEVYLGERPAPGPLFNDAYQALYSAAPQYLRETWGSATRLRSRVQKLVAAERERWPMRLWGAAAQRPGSRRLGLRGGTPGEALPRPSLAFSNCVEARLRRLYPSTTPEDIQQTLQDWARTLRSPETELRLRENALQRLRLDLGRWANSARRQSASARIVNSWRRNSVRWLADGVSLQSLDLSDLALENHDLNALAMPDGLGHVGELDLRGNHALSELPVQWLQRMPNLKRLILTGCRFDRLPQIPNPQELQWLELEHNRITWDSQAQVTLESLTALRVLELSENPLLNAPDLSRMPRISSLFLVNCSLTHLPQGLERLESPIIVDLSGNQFQRLPGGFTLPARTASALSLESPSLGLPMLEEIEEYFQTHGEDLMVADMEYQPLLAEASAERRALWLKLPLQYRRDLRNLIDDIGDLDDLNAGFEALWQRLERMDVDAAFRDLALDSPAVELLEL